MTEWGLPTSVTINGTSYAIRSDFRTVLDLMTILDDAELSDGLRGSLALEVFYPDFDQMRPEDYQEAVEYLKYFIAGGEMEAKAPQSKLADWQQDFPLIIAPVNRVLGFEARAADYVHWWTFLSAYYEIGDCLFAQVVSIRKKINEGKKLEKWERDFYRKNREKVDMKSKATSADIEFLKSLEK